MNPLPHSIFTTASAATSTAPEVAARVAAYATTQSPFPSSFDDNPWLYGSALDALLCISVFSAITMVWMARDLWLDRMHDHPLSLPFAFRFMCGLASLAVFILVLPQVVYMTLFGEVTGAMISKILIFKRVADVAALPVVVLWFALLVVIYPSTIKSLHVGRFRSQPAVDPLSVWHRLARPFLIFLTVLAIATLMTIAKGSMG